MGRSSKRKGSAYELEFVRKVQDFGLPAHKVPLSGALGGIFSDDVVVADEWRIEGKYRATGTGFKSLYDLASAAVTHIDHPGGSLMVWTLEEWCRCKVIVLDECEPLITDFATVDSGREFATLRTWICGADYLAVRMPRQPWLVVEVLT